MRVPAALASIPLLAGALIGLLIPEEARPGAGPLAAAGGALALLSAIGGLSVGARDETTAALAAGCLLAGVSLGSTSAARTYQPSLIAWYESRPGAAAGTPVQIEGILREDASSWGSSSSLLIDVGRADGLPVLGGVRLSVVGAPDPGRLRQWRAGRAVRVPALLRLPSTYRNPGVRDDRRALARRGSVLVGTVKSAALVEIVSRGSLKSESAATSRAWVRRCLASSVGRWSARSGAVATAVLIGDRTGLSDADTRRLQDAGTYHVIAISGGNIAILTLVLFGVLGGAGLSGRASAAATIVLLLLYREVVVPSPSVHRAVSAAVLYLAARVLDQRGAALNVLAIAAGLGVAVAPVLLLDPGFMLSFGATLGILVVAGRQKGSEQRGGSSPGRLLKPLWVLLWTTLAAEAALLPLAAVLFGRVTFAGILLNFAAIPLMAVLQGVSILALAAWPLSQALAATAGYAAHLAAEGIIESARLTELLPGLARDVYQPAWWVIACYYTSALTLAAGRGLRLRQVSAAALVIAAGVLVLGPGWAVMAMSPPASGVRVVVLDVGQGDATAIVLPGGRAVLVDAGGIVASGVSPDGDVGFDIGRRVVAPALRALGVRHLDALAITHGDPDHIGGAAAILQAFRPGSIWEGVPVPPHLPLRALLDLTNTFGGHWRTVQPGDVVRTGPVAIKVLHPPLPDWERQRVRNEDSIVLDVRLGEVSIVLPGDIGAEGEKAVLAHLDPARLTVLKAPHHGSATSSSSPFLSVLKPSAVIFSAGRNNRFGHPAAAVVARYRAGGVAMFSTAEDGAVFLETDGTTLTVKGWTGRQIALRP